MQQVMFANGKLWGALDTALNPDGGAQRAGIAWYIVNPNAGKVVNAGLPRRRGLRLHLPGHRRHRQRPRRDGVHGHRRHAQPERRLRPDRRARRRRAPGASSPGGQGAAPDDGFTSYKSQVGNPPRTRWGDYGAAAVDGNTVWIASEYIAHACDYTTWGGPFFVGGTGDNLLGTCARVARRAPGTRAALGNWSTRISKLHAVASANPLHEQGSRSHRGPCSMSGTGLVHSRTVCYNSRPAAQRALRLPRFTVARGERNGPPARSGGVTRCDEMRNGAIHSAVLEVRLFYEKGWSRERIARFTFGLQRRRLRAIRVRQAPVRGPIIPARWPPSRSSPAPTRRSWWRARRRSCRRAEGPLHASVRTDTMAPDRSVARPIKKPSAISPPTASPVLGLPRRADAPFLRGSVGRRAAALGLLIEPSRALTRR